MHIHSRVFGGDQVLTKKIISDIEDIINRIKVQQISGRDTSVAITHLETAQLWLTQAQDNASTPG